VTTVCRKVRNFVVLISKSCIPGKKSSFILTARVNTILKEEEARKKRAVKMEIFTTLISTHNDSPSLALQSMQGKAL